MSDERRKAHEYVMASSRAPQDNSKMYQDANANDESNKRREELEDRIAEAKARRLLNGGE